MFKTKYMLLVSQEHRMQNKYGAPQIIESLFSNRETSQLNVLNRPVKNLRRTKVNIWQSLVFIKMGGFRECLVVIQFLIQLLSSYNPVVIKI